MPLPSATITTSFEEFWYNVSQQHELPLAERKPRPREIGLLNEIADHIRGSSAEAIRAELAKKILLAPELLHWLRTLVSISDKRFYLDLSYLFARLPNPNNGLLSLCGCPQQGLTRHSTSFFLNLVKGANSPSEPKRRLAISSANEISRYLLDKGLVDILILYSELNPVERELLITNLVIPGELQQQDAKLRGHGIERALAELVVRSGAKITPPEKAINPMGAHDPNINPETMEICPRVAGSTYSTDMIIHDYQGKPKILVVGLIHTSDPGQFGVDKSSTVVDLRRKIDQYNHNRPLHDAVELWGLVDGVGYSENKAGTIEKMIPHLHLMIQNHTLYKAALRLHTLGMTRVAAIYLDRSFYTDSALQYMQNCYVPPPMFKKIVNRMHIHRGSKPAKPR